MLGPVFLGLLIIVASSDGIISLLLPGGGAIFSVFLRVVEGVNESHILVHVSTNIVIVD